MKAKFKVATLAIVLATTFLTLHMGVHGAFGQTTVVAFGDSITEGFGSTPYSAFLQQQFTANNCDVVVVNEGLPGELSFDGASRIDSVLAAHNPQYILIMEGANDVIIGVSSEITAASISTMINKAKAAGATPIVSSITPNTSSGVENELIPDVYNPAIRQETRASGVRYVDNYEALAGTNWASYQVDGFHLSDQGQNVVAQEFFKVLPCPSAGGSGGGGGGGCFIATAAYGSMLEPQVKLLRLFRDNFLMTNEPGQALVKFYYTYSPPLAEIIRHSRILQATVRVALLPLVGVAYILVNELWYLAALMLLLPLLFMSRWILQRAKLSA